MVNFYNFKPDLETNAKDSFTLSLVSLFGNLKRLALIMFMVLAFSQLSWAQSAANYAFTTNASSSLLLDANGNAIDMSSGTTQLVGAGLDATASAVTNIGFNFIFMGNTFSQYSVNEDGQLKLGGTVVGTNSYTITSGTWAAPLLSAFNADLRTGTTTGKVHYKVVGTAPNRTLVVEFKDMQLFYTTAAAGTSTWQMRLYETSGIVEYVYGTVNVTSTSASSKSPSIGLYIGSTTNLFASVNYATQTVSVVSPYAANAAVAATGDIAALSSAADGSRRAYRFTPPTGVTPADPMTLSFTAITPSAITPNWVDNSIDESLFIVTRATDAAFTQNVVTASVSSTTAATTGTAYSLPQTGLLPNTVYYFKVQAGSEVGVPSTGVTGSQATLDRITYYWVGATGGALGTATNWNTAADGTGSARTTVENSDILIVDGNGATPGGTTTISVDVASFSIGQFKVTNNTACTLQSSATTTRTITLTGGTGDDFLIEAGSTLVLNHAANAVAFAFSGSGNTGLIAGTYTAGGSTSNNITTTGGTGTVFTVAATGVVNNGILGTTGCITGSTASLIFANGSNYTHSGYTTTNAYIPTATWGATATATLTGGTTGTGVTTSSTVLGNLVYNGAMTAASSFVLFASGTPTIQGNLIVNSTNYNFGTDSGPKFRPITTGTLTINGNLEINGGYVEVATTATTGIVIVNGATTINSGAGMNLSLGTLRQRGAVFTNNGSMGGLNAAAKLIFDGSVPQTLTGTGVMLNAGNFYSFTLENPAGLTITHTNQIPVLNISLISGTITNSNKLTMGTGAAAAVTTQIGKAGLLTPGGSFDQSPVWSLGTGTYTLLYQEESVSRTSGFEVPPTRTATNMTVANPNGLILSGGNLAVGTALTLTSGIVTTSAANLLSLGTAAAAGTLTGGSATSYIKGPFSRTIASGNANTNYILYPVGKTAYNPVSLAPATTAVSVMKAEAFDINTGTTDASIMSLSSKRWEAPLVSGTISNINVKLGDAGIAALNIPVQAPSAAGVYTNAFGSVATYAAGTPNTTTSNTPVVAGSYTGYLAYALSNACSGTPAPGATTASSTTFCTGGSVTLGITTVPAGTGITYQWQSSPDGVSFSNIASATNVTYIATPAAPTYYQCVVTCSAGPVSGTSTPVQITFANTITGTTPATRCGTGTVNLGATASVGAVKWYAAATGGVPIATGSPFTTPILSANTTYYVASETATPLTASLGNGATNSTSVAESFFPGSWGGTKTQYIIRASELIAAGFTAGNLSSLGFEPTTSGQTYQGFYVNIGHTSNTTAPTTTFLTSGLTQVYAGTGTNDAFTPTANSVNTLSFGTGAGSASSFYWDGTSNIVVSISWSSVPSATTATSSSMKVDNVGFVSSAYRQRDSVTPAAMLAETSVNSTTSIRPRFTINGQIICSSLRVAVQATVTTPPAFALSAGATAICNGSSSSAITVTTGAANYDTYVWSPSTGVTGDSATGWVFNPTTTTTYMLTASQSSGSLCSTIATVNVTVNPLPTAVAISPSSASVCQGVVQTLVATLPTSGTIGSGTSSAGTTSYPNPLSAFYGGVKHQMIYTATELTALGMSNGYQITKVALDINAFAANACTNLTIRMKGTSSTTLSGFEAGTTDVYGPTTFTPSGTGLATFVLTTPFTWNGSDNIIIEFVHNAGNSGNGSGTTVKYTTTPDNKTYYGAKDSVAGGVAGFDALSAYSVSGATTSRPNVKLDFTSANPITWSPATDLYTDAAATVAYTAGTNATTVYFKSTTAGNHMYTVTVTSSSSCTSTTMVGVDVMPNRTVSLTSTTGTDAQTVCINSAITNIAYTVGNATNATVTGLPSGVTGNYVAGTLTISGTPTAAGTFNYTVTPVGCGTATATGSITVNQTAQPSASSQTFCNSATVTNLVATGTLIQWYAGPTGGSALVSTDALATGTYYVTQTISGCESSRLAVSVTVNVTAQPTASSQTFCNSATVANLTATGTTIQWYAGPSGGSALALTDALSTGNYYVTQTISGCESPRLSVSVTVNVVGAPTGASTQTISVPVASDATIEDIVVTGSNIIWYPTAADALAGTNALAAGTQLINGSVYYATQTVGGCTSTSSLAVTITVTLGVKDFALNSLKLYPNPVTDVLTIENGQAISGVEIYNIAGQKVMVKAVNAITTTIDMSGLAGGAYLIKVTSDDAVKTVKVIKK